VQPAPVPFAAPSGPFPRAGLPPACPEVQVLAYRSFPLLIFGKTPCMDLLCPWVMDKQSERISMENPQRNPASNGTEYGAGNLFLGDVREELWQS